MSTGPARRAAETDAHRDEDATLTLDQWGEMDAPTLRLKCEQYKLIATGKKDVLKQRLYDHFHHVSSGSQSPPPPKTPTRPQRNLDDSPSELPDDEIDLDFGSGDELFHPEPAVNHPGQRPPSLTPPPDSPNHVSDVSNHDDVHENPTMEYAMTTIQPTTTPTITTTNGGAYTYQFGLAQNLPPQQQDGGLGMSAARQVQLQQTNELLVHEIRALRSEVKNNKNNLAKLQQQQQQKVGDHNNKSKRKRATDSQQTRPPKRSRTSTTQRNASSSTLVRPPPPPPPSPHAGALNTNPHVYPGANNYHNTVHVPPSRPVNCNTTSLNNSAGATSGGATPGMSSMYYNPFLPRSVKKELLKKIEKGEFVCFEELIPENQTNDSLSGAAGPGIDIDESAGILKFKRHKFTKVKLNSFQRWCTSWNAFMEAHLHFHPQDYFNLFTYFRLFVSLIQQYRFEACANYDRHFRLRMANQASFAPSQRNVHWTVICEELRSHWLTGNELIRCEYCLTPGHIASNCRQKRQDQQEGLPQQLAAVLRQQPCWAQPQQQPTCSQQQMQQPAPPFQCNPSNAQASGSNRGSNGSMQQPQQSRRDPTPPAKKPCTRFNANRHCAKPPCQFGHFCSNCGRTNHNATNCYATTSTQFQPQNGP